MRTKYFSLCIFQKHINIEDWIVTMYQHILVNGVVKIVQWNNYIISVVRVKNISIVIHILNKNLSVCVPECVTHKVVYQKKIRQAFGKTR